MPALTSPVQTWIGGKLEPFMHPELVKTQSVKLKAIGSVTFYKRGTIFSQDQTTPYNFLAYDNSTAGAGDVAACILPYDIVVNTDGTYWFANVVAGGYPGPHGEFRTNIDMYFGGCFRTDDLYVGAGSATAGTASSPTATQLNAALGDWNATTVIMVDASTDPDTFVFRF